MPTFKGSYFSIELPADFSDESTYAFALPARANFRPSVVVKAERLTQPTELGAYVEQQLDKIKKALPHMNVLSVTPPKPGEAAVTSIYEFGEAAQRVRQKQRYVLLKDPARVVTLTATSSRDTFGQTEALFDAILRSFKPLDREGRVSV
ncbi:MAG: DcrB-related protein [Burkholderiales bacterium]